MRAMANETMADDLPLQSRTSGAWAAAALRDPLALLNDHAHLEKKAAANALDMLSRWPGDPAPTSWVTALTAIARDEIEHLAIVCRLLNRRGGRLTRTHHNAYASGLRERVRRGRGPQEVLDRLLVSALIEARSCERFAVLARHAQGVDAELAKLYQGLFASEAGHYRTFIDMARQVPGVRDVDERWAQMLRDEAQVLAAQTPGPRMHSGEG
jgi:tRNA-(ms[2]io[6]A)-hydroxylase